MAAEGEVFLILLLLLESDVLCCLRRQWHTHTHTQSPQITFVYPVHLYSSHRIHCSTCLITIILAVVVWSNLMRERERGTWSWKLLALKPLLSLSPLFLSLSFPRGNFWAHLSSSSSSSYFVNFFFFSFPVVAMWWRPTGHWEWVSEWVSEDDDACLPACL